MFAPETLDIRKVGHDCAWSSDDDNFTAYCRPGHREGNTGVPPVYTSREALFVSTVL